MNFFKRYPLTCNLLAMFIVGILLVSLVMWSLKILTAHGQVQEVPDVRTLSVAEAQAKLKEYNLLSTECFTLTFSLWWMGDNDVRMARSILSLYSRDAKSTFWVGCYCWNLVVLNGL